MLKHFVRRNSSKYEQSWSKYDKEGGCSNHSPIKPCIWQVVAVLHGAKFNSLAENMVGNVKYQMWKEQFKLISWIVDQSPRLKN